VVSSGTLLRLLEVYRRFRRTYSLRIILWRWQQ